MKSLFASLLFFTRLPLWKLKMFQLPSEAFEKALHFVPVVGWLTGGIMAGTLWLSSQILPFSVAIILALGSRVLPTGALHEDGLADFFDGFGGGYTQERILEIMKDSHIGTYGVLALVLYFLTSVQVLQSFNDVQTVCILLFIADPFSRGLVSMITAFLPYVRTQETSKAKVIYQKMHGFYFLIPLVFSGLPLLLLPNWKYLLAFVPTILLYALLLRYINRKIGGYTGDTCGAIFLLCEFSVWLVFSGIFLYL